MKDSDHHPRKDHMTEQKIDDRTPEYDDPDTQLPDLDTDPSDGKSEDDD